MTTYWFVIKWLLIIVLSIFAALGLIGAAAVTMKILWYKFRRTKFYAWIVRNKGLSVSEQEWERLVKEEWKIRDLGGEQCLKIDGEWYLYVPDYIGDGPGSFVNWDDYRENKSSFDIRVYDLVKRR